LGAQNLVQVGYSSYLLGGLVSVVLVALFSCLFKKLSLQINTLCVEDGTLAVLNAFCLRGSVGLLDIGSVVFLGCEQASSTDAFVISYKSLWRYEFFLLSLQCLQ